jgi:hypothetical protein
MINFNKLKMNQVHDTIMHLKPMKEVTDADSKNEIFIFI